MGSSNKEKTTRAEMKKTERGCKNPESGLRSSRGRPACRKRTRFPGSVTNDDNGGLQGSLWDKNKTGMHYLRNWIQELKENTLAPGFRVPSTSHAQCFNSHFQEHAPLQIP